MLNEIINSLKYPIKKVYWRIRNKENSTFMTRNFSISQVCVGRGTYGPLSVYYFGTKDEKLEIGNYCSIGPNVTFLLGGEHNYKNISTYPFKHFKDGTAEAISKGIIKVEDDVWIGYGSIILSGVKIGQGAVIGAGSVVSKDVPPYAIFANGQVIKYRFEEDVIKKLLKADLTKLTREKIINNIDILYTGITQDNIDEIIQKLEI